MEFMKSIPKIYDVYCIDLPGWGISDTPTSTVNLHEYYSKIILKTMTEIHPFENSKFILIGHSVGSFLLSHAITSGIIPSSKISKCIFSALPGLSQNVSRFSYLWGLVVRSEIIESMFKQWWSPHLFSAFLYPRTTSIDKINLIHRFLPCANEYKLDGTHIELLLLSKERRRALLFASTRVPITLVCGYNDTIVDYKYVKDFSDESDGLIKFVGLDCGHFPFKQSTMFSQLKMCIYYDNILKSIKKSHN
jgi:pimeloyl-ACP methyl ester carboxylesterase